MSAYNVRVAGICALLVSAAFGQTYSNQYALILKDPPVAERFAGREAMSSPAAAAHRRVIAAAQQTLRDAAVARNFVVNGSADTVFNAVFVTATPDRMTEMQSLPGVLGVVQMRNVKPWLNAATALQNAPAAWAALGGQGSAGAGVKIGVWTTVSISPILRCKIRACRCRFGRTLAEVHYRTFRRLRLHQHQSDRGADLRT